MYRFAITQSRKRYYWHILNMDDDAEENLKKEIPLFPQKNLDKFPDLCHDKNDERGEHHDI